MVTLGEGCFRLTKDDLTEITELRSMQEEADTRMIIHVKHAAASYRKVLVISEDSDVFIILLSLHSQIPTRILLRKGKGNAVGQDACQKHAMDVILDVILLAPSGDKERSKLSILSTRAMNTDNSS